MRTIDHKIFSRNFPLDQFNLFYIERKNGIVNKSFESEAIEESHEKDSDSSLEYANEKDNEQPVRAQTEPPTKAPRTKKNVSKTVSMPDTKKKMKKRERNMMLVNDEQCSFLKFSYRFYHFTLKTFSS